MVMSSPTTTTTTSISSSVPSSTATSNTPNTIPIQESSSSTSQQHHHHIPSMSAAATVTATAIPPIIHAVSGSIGSTLSMLLLYPLERARIELQTQVTSTTDEIENGERRERKCEINSNENSTSCCSNNSNVGNDDDDNNNDNDEASITDQHVLHLNENEKFINEENNEKPNNNNYESESSLSSGEFSFEHVHMSSTSIICNTRHTHETFYTIHNHEEDDKSNHNDDKISDDTSTNPNLIETKQLGPLSTNKNNFIPINPKTTKNHRTIKKKQDGIYNTMKKLYRRNELYKGVTPVASTIAISNFIFFYALQFTKKIIHQFQLQHCLISSGDNSISSSGDYGGGSFSGSNQKYYTLVRLLFLQWRRKNNLHDGTSMNVQSSSLSKAPMSNKASLLASTIAGIVNVLLTNPLWMANLRLIQYTEEEQQQQEGDNGSDSMSDKHVMSITEIEPSTKTTIPGKMKKNKKSNMTLWKMIRYIVRNEGVKKLWNGTFTSLILVCNPAIQYYIYEKCKYEIISMRRMRCDSIHDQGNGSLIHLFFQRYWQQRQQEQGIDVATSHVNSSDVRNSVAAGDGINGLSPLDAFILGALAKAIATVMTYPLQLAQVLMRLQTSNHRTSNDNSGKDMPKTKMNIEITNKNDYGDDEEEYESVSRRSLSIDNDSTITASATKHENKHNNEDTAIMPSTPTYQYNGTLDCMIQLYQKGGLKALYRGMDSKLLQTVLTSAFTFLTYEQIVSMLTRSFLSLMKSSSTSSIRT